MILKKIAPLLIAFALSASCSENDSSREKVKNDLEEEVISVKEGDSNKNSDAGGTEYCAVPITGMAPDQDVVSACLQLKTASSCNAFKSDKFPQRCEWGLHKTDNGPLPPSAN